MSPLLATTALLAFASLMSTGSVSAQVLPAIPSLEAPETEGPLPPLVRMDPQNSVLVGGLFDPEEHEDQTTALLRQASERKLQLRIVTTIWWGLVSLLSLSVSGIVIAGVTPFPVEALLIGAAPVLWCFEVAFRETAEERLWSAWQALSPSQQATEHARFRRYMRSLAKQERRQRDLTAVSGFVVGGLGLTAAIGAIELDGPLGAIPLGITTFVLGVLFGTFSLFYGSSEQVFDASIPVAEEPPSLGGL